MGTVYKIYNLFIISNRYYIQFLLFIKSSDVQQRRVVIPAHRYKVPVGQKRDKYKNL